MAEAPRPLDSEWLRAHPLPGFDEPVDKNSRGRVLAVGGCTTVPGGIQLTAEAALRAGAGKLQVATVTSAALALGIAMPEVAVFALPEDASGDISLSGEDRLSDLLAACDAVVVGPAMTDPKAAAALTSRTIEGTEAQCVLDAAALHRLPDLARALRNLARPPVLTPNTAEMAAMLGREVAQVEKDCIGSLREACGLFGAVCVLKGPTSLVATPGGEIFAYAGGGVGLATGGSGDVLAGLVAGLCARGAGPFQAAMWGVWLHGEAGRRCAEEIGPIGFLARDLLARVPGLMRGV